MMIKINALHAVAVARGELARSGALPFGLHSYAGRHYATLRRVAEPDVATLRLALPRSFAPLRRRPPPLSSPLSAPPQSLDQKAVFGTATQSQDYLSPSGR